MSDERTKDIATRGKQALDEWRQGAQYGINNRDQALKFLLDTGYSNMVPTAGYQQWHDQRGFDPTQYDISYGRGNGKYAGFNTLGELKAAVLGRSEMLRESDRSQADRLASLADQYLNQATGMYDKSLSAATRDVGKQVGWNPAKGMFRDTFDVFGDGQPSRATPWGKVLDTVNRVPELGYKQGVAAKQGELNQWLGQTADPYLSALETAGQVSNTPLRDYAGIAGAEYGVDPTLIAGWYPESSQIKDFTQQRDLSALNQFGLTQNEYEQVLAQLQKEQAANDPTNPDNVSAAMESYINQASGMDANQLAQAADVTTDQLYSVVSSDEYAALNDELYAAIQLPGGRDAISAAVEKVLARVRTDPMLARILNAQWGAYVNG